MTRTSWNMQVRSGVPPTEIISALSSHQYEPHVRTDFMSGVRAGVNGTPTFFIDGVRFDGVPDVESLLSAVEAVADAKR